MALYGSPATGAETKGGERMTDQERDTATRIKDKIDQMSPEALETLDIMLQGMALGLQAQQTVASMDAIAS